MSKIKHFFIASFVLIIFVFSSCTSISSETKKTNDNLAIPEDFSEISGLWFGDLKIQGQTLRLAFIIDKNPFDYNRVLFYFISVDQGGTSVVGSSLQKKDDEWVLYFEDANVKCNFKVVDKDNLAGKFWQNGLTLNLSLKRASRPDTPEPPFDYESIDVSFKNEIDNIDLYGTLTIPSNLALSKNGKLPCIIFITGSGAQDRDENMYEHKPFFLLSDYFTKVGFATLRMDDRGIGYSSELFTNSTSLDFANDIISAVKFAESQTKIDADRIGLCGHSEGGLIAFIVGATIPDKISFIISLAGPGQRGKELLLTQQILIAKAYGISEKDIEKGNKLNEELFDTIILHKNEKDTESLEKDLINTLNKHSIPKSQQKLLLAQLLNPWFRFFIACDPKDYLKDVKAHVLAVNGELDLQVYYKDNLSQIEKTLKQNGNYNVLTKSFPGLNHLFQPAKTGNPSEYMFIEQTFSKEVMEFIKLWLLELNK